MVSTQSLIKCCRFRWVYCQLDTLRQGFPSNIRSVLEQLPETLDEVYEHALLRIDKRRRKFARQIFQSLIVSARPLRVEELADILIAQIDTGTASEFNTDWRPGNAEKAILFACSSLITVVDASDGSRVVQLFHFSVKDFLTSNRLAKAKPDLSYYHVTPQSANATLTKACLNVLLKLDENIDREGIKSFPLAGYASRHWFTHCLRLDPMPQDIHDDTLRLFDQDEPHFSAWIWLYDMDNPSGESMSTERPEQPKAVPLYYATRGRFQWLVEGLAATHPEDTGNRGGYFETPLFKAFCMRNAKLSMSLLRRGADPNVLNGDGASVLHYASHFGNAEFVLPLLRYKADVDLPNSEGRTPLGVSSAAGQLGVSHLLVQWGAKVDARDDDGRTPLWYASHYGHLDIVRFLVDSDADVNSADKEGWTPIQSASSQGNLEVVEFLLEQGGVTDPSINDRPSVSTASHKRWMGVIILACNLVIPIAYIANRTLRLGRT
jgi:hypothetical protein